MKRENVYASVSTNLPSFSYWYLTHFHKIETWSWRSIIFVNINHEIVKKKVNPQENIFNYTDKNKDETLQVDILFKHKSYGKKKLKK